MMENNQELDAALREVERKNARIAELEAALRVAMKYVSAEVIDWGAVAAGLGEDNIRTPNPDHATVKAALTEARDDAR